MTRLIDCARCQHERPHSSRGLCNSCARTARRHGELDQYPRLYLRRNELLEEWDFLRRAGTPPAQAAHAMGMSCEAFERALYRAKKRGDARAVGFGRREQVSE